MTFHHHPRGGPHCHPHPHRFGGAGECPPHGGPHCHPRFGAGEFPPMPPHGGPHCHPGFGGGECPPMPPHGMMPPHVPPHMRGPHGWQGWKEMKQGKPVLTYFDTAGWAEQSRLCFIIGDVPFVDRRVTREDWGKHYKAYSPTGRGPYLEVNGKVLVESQAILQYAGRRAGLVPSTAEEQLKVSMVIELMESDVKEQTSKAPEFADMASYMKWAVELMTATFPLWCDKFEAMFKSWMSVENGDEWLVGNKMSILDVYVAAAVLRAESMTGLKLMPDDAKYPVLSKVYQGVVDHPRVKAYLTERKKKTEKPVFYHFGYHTFVQPIFWAMKIGKIDFEDRAVTREEWAAGLKSQSPSGQLPMLEMDGEKYVESLAIMQYVAIRAGLVPESDFNAAHALAVVKVCGDLRELAGRIFHCTDAASKATLVEKAEKVTIPEMVARIEEVIGQHQDQEGHVVGKKLSYADLWVAQTFSGLLQCGAKGIKLADVESMAPRMKKTHEMVLNIPAVAELEAKQMMSVKPVLTYFDLSGRAEALRYAMLLGGVEFEDRRFSHDDWNTIYKAMSPTGQCPLFTVGQGQTIVEAKAIMQWIQEAAPQLKPTGYMGRVIAEQLVSSWSRVHAALMVYWETPEAERPSIEGMVRDEKVAPAMAMMERLWTDSKTHEGYSVGGKTTWVDAWVAGELEYVKWRRMVGDDWQETYPTLAAIYRRVTTHPKVAAFRAAHAD